MSTVRNVRLPPPIYPCPLLSSVTLSPDENIVCIQVCVWVKLISPQYSSQRAGQRDREKGVPKFCQNLSSDNKVYTEEKEGRARESECVCVREN